MHNADLAPVLALAPTAESATPVSAPGYRAIAGSRALPHPSCARNLWSPRMGRIWRCLTFCAQQNMAEGEAEYGGRWEGRRKEGRLQVATQAARRLRELQEPGSCGEAPWEAASQHTP